MEHYAALDAWVLTEIAEILTKKPKTKKTKKIKVAEGP